jgi:hypothetical protein
MLSKQAASKIGWCRPAHDSDEYNIMVQDFK